MHRLALAVLVLVLALASGAAARKAPPPELAKLRVSWDRQEVVFDHSRDACGKWHYPDLPVRALRDASGQIQVTIAQEQNRRLIGPSFDRLSAACDVVLESHHDPRPEAYDDNEWLSATWTPDGKTVYALIHNEYQGHEHAGRCDEFKHLPLGERYALCQQRSVTLAVSRDGGASYEHSQTPPGQVIAPSPHRYKAGQGVSGYGGTSNIVRHPRNGYFYALFVWGLPKERWKQGELPSWVCVARTRTLGDPRSWLGPSGLGWGFRFVDPYAGEARECERVGFRQIQRMHQSITWNTYLQRFLLVGTHSELDRTRNEQVGGVYWSLSKDLVTWSPRRLLAEVETVHTWKCGDGPHDYFYPSVIDPRSPGRNFDVSGKSFHLYLTRTNQRADCKFTTDRDLVRVPVEITR